MKKKNHAKVYVISDSMLRQVINPEEELEYSLAMDAVRAKCFSSADLKGVAEDDKGQDWEMNKALTEAMIRTCDVVAVLGGNVTPDMENEINLASNLGKEICVAEPIRNIVKKMNIKVSANMLAKVCKDVLQKNKEELAKCR